MRPDEARVREVQERGFTLVEGVLESWEIPPLKDLLETCIDEDLQRWGGKSDFRDGWMVQNLMMRGLPFALLLENEAIQAYFSALLGDTCIIYAYTSSSMPPGGSNFSHRIHVDCPRVIPDYITNATCLIALDDYTPENGATYFLPGSQHRLDKPSEEEFLARAERGYPRAGDAVFFNCRTYHMGGQNKTNLARHAIGMQAVRSYMRQRFDFPRMVPAEVLEYLGDVGRRFLGFNVRMPTSMEEYYVPEEKRLYKANQG
jgi:ectoine hydroxylase-related dioxygenase (phytanoyl-CoA dioxygenase family)